MGEEPLAVATPTIITGQQALKLALFVSTRWEKKEREENLTRQQTAVSGQIKLSSSSVVPAPSLSDLHVFVKFLAEKNPIRFI